MTDEIIKLYENAGVETNKYKLCCTGCKHIVKLEVINGYPSKWICDKYDEVANCDKAEPDYSPFTAEKQIEIAKMILFSTWWMNLKRLQFSEKFDEGLAQMINELWQDLSEEEKQQVKEILNG